MRFHRTAVVMALSLTVPFGLQACAAPAGTSGASSTAATEVNPAGDIPDNQAFITTTGPTSKYQVQVPEGWAETRTGTSLSYTDKLNSIAIEEGRAPSAPTVKSVTADQVPLLKHSARNMVLTDVSEFSLPGGRGVLIRYTDDSAPDPVTGKIRRQSVERYLFWKNGTLASLTLAGPTGADNVDPWAKVSGSFRWLK